MSSSRRTSSTTGRSASPAIAARDIAYARHRLRTRIFEEVLQAFVERHREDGTTKADLAQALGCERSQITRWLSGPGNWTINTISDLMLALRTELELGRIRFEHKPLPNYRHELSPVETESMTGVSVTASAGVQVRRQRIEAISAASPASSQATTSDQLSNWPPQPA